MADVSSGTHGPVLLADGMTRFSLWAPSVDAVGLKIEDGPLQPMIAGSGGWFVVETQAEPGARYSFVLPDGLTVPDPASRGQAQDVHGNSIVVDTCRFHWKNASWRNRPWHEAVIYELHVGLMGGFAGVTSRLGELAKLGFTAIELMPIADFPGRHNWGYDGVLSYAPDRAYGTPEELCALIDAAHGEGLMVFLDVVYNHFGPDGAYLHAYAKAFFDDGVHTPWGAAIDFRRTEVRDFFVQNALMWVNDYRFDGLRFDAVHAISPASFLPDLAAAIRAGAERPVHLVLEHEGNKASLLHGPTAKLFDAQWADDWHHCLHVLLTGESEGYYESFQSPAEQLACAMAEGFVYQGQISPHHKERRGEPSSDLPTTAFVIIQQNQEKIKKNEMGERLTQLADREALAVATALLLLSPNIPLVFMGEEFGSRTPFLFFTDHNDELAGLVREGRRREFAHFAAFQDEARRALIPDPNAETTFAASAPSDQGDPAILEFYRTLLKLRRDVVMPGIPDAVSAGARALGAHAVQGAWRMGDGRVLTLVANFDKEAVPFDVPPGKLLFEHGSRPANAQLTGPSIQAYLADAA